MTHATPRPWKVDMDGRAILALFEGEHVQIASMSRTSWSNDQGGLEKNVRLSTQMPANAALIVHAVNTLDEAKAAIKAVLNEYDKATMFDGNGSAFDKLRAVLAKLEACQ